MKILNRILTLQQDIIVGTLLGDAKRVFSRMDRASYVCEQSIIHKDYLFHLFDVFSELCVMVEPVKREAYDKRDNVTNISYYFGTSTLQVLVLYAELFYTLNANGGKTKIVPKTMELLTPRALAYWIMDDGQYVAGGGVTLCTDSFTLEQVNLLVSVLSTKYGLVCSFHNKKGNARIYIKAESLSTLRALVGMYMHPSFSYKLYK